MTDLYSRKYNSSETVWMSPSPPLSALSPSLSPAPDRSLDHRRRYRWWRSWWQRDSGVRHHRAAIGIAVAALSVSALLFLVIGGILLFRHTSAFNRSSLPRHPVVLYRILGNDLTPRHRKGQTLSNMEFILRHEQPLPHCDKRWIVNRILDPVMERKIISKLQEYRQEYTVIPFDADEYLQQDWDLEIFPERHFFTSPSFRIGDANYMRRAVDAMYASKNRYLINNNGARNVALREGKEDGYRWILPWDGNSFVTEEAWKEILLGMRMGIEEPMPVKNESHGAENDDHDRRNPLTDDGDYKGKKTRRENNNKETSENTVTDSSSNSTLDNIKYVVVPMARITDNHALFNASFSPTPVEEPQIAFHCNAFEEFDPQMRYGRRPKVDLLYRLQVPGPWDRWGQDPWEKPHATHSPDAGRFIVTGWVARLFSGKKEYEVKGRLSQRGRTRLSAVKDFLDSMDEHLFRSRGMFDSRRLFVLNESDLDQRRSLYMHGRHRSSDPFRRLVDRLVEEAHHISAAMPRSSPSTVQESRDNGEDSLKLPSVVHKRSEPPSGDVHDYWSAKTSFERGTDSVHRETDTGSQAMNHDRDAFRKMTMDVMKLVLAGYYTNDRLLHENAARLLRTWFGNPATAMNPHLSYAACDGENAKGESDGIFEMNRIYYLLDAVRLIQRHGVWSHQDDIRFKMWCRQYLTWLTESAAGVRAWRFEDHRSVWYDVQRGALAAFLDDYVAFSDTMRKAKLRIVDQINANGTQPAIDVLIPPSVNTPDREGAHYRNMRIQRYGSSLHAWAALARIAGSGGVDLWTWRAPETGRGLMTAFRYLRHDIHGSYQGNGRTPRSEQDDALLALDHITSGEYLRRPAAAATDKSQLSKPVPDQYKMAIEIDEGEYLPPYWNLSM